MGAIKNHLAAALAIAAVLLLSGCDLIGRWQCRDAENRALEAEAKATELLNVQAELKEKLREAEKKADRAEDYRRAAAIAQACDFPVVWRLCPQETLALGKSAISEGYPPDQGVFWAIKIGILAAIGAAVAAGWALWLRIGAPLQGEIEEARQMIATAKEQAERWQLAELEAKKAAQKAAQEAAEKIAAARDELEDMAAQKTALQADLQAARAELKRTRADIEALRGGFF
jgi:DNA repair exonuclease SbcCD ATPase subunit